MKKPCLLLIIPLFSLSPSNVKAQKRINPELNHAPAEELFSRIERQSGYRIFAPAGTDTLRFTLSFTGELPDVALQKAFEGTPYRTSVYRDQYLFVLKDKELTTLLRTADRRRRGGKAEVYFRE